MQRADRVAAGRLAERRLVGGHCDQGNLPAACFLGGQPQRGTGGREAVYSYNNGHVILLLAISRCLARRKVTSRNRVQKPKGSPWPFHRTPFSWGSAYSARASLASVGRVTRRPRLTWGPTAYAQMA